MRAADGIRAALARGQGGIGPEELYPPDQYSGWWLLLAVAILAVLIAATAAILVATRARRPRPDQGPPGTPVERLGRLRLDYLHRIDQIEAAHADGRIDARRVHAELSALTRAFVNDYTGIATPVMSLEEIGTQQVHPALVAALETYYYPSIFGDRPPGDPAPGIAAAREVVTAWQ